MCGVLGVYHRNRTIDLPSFVKAQSALNHRGPDNNGLWLSENKRVGLAHTRLSIIDEPNGAQPLFNHDKSICAVVNGEFYEYARLRKGLESKGCQFSSSSDSELIIHLYEQFSLNCLEHLRGEFSFILYDRRNNRLFAARDRFGIKPLCYYHDKSGSFYVASEAKAMFQLGVIPAWNEYALYHTFCFQYPPINQTLFQGIYNLPAGHLLIYDGQKVSIQSYWDLDYPTKDATLCQDEHALTEALSVKLKEAIGLRLEAGNAKICCHLSGGIDSASIAAIGSELYGKPLPCFTVAFPHQDYNELDYAKCLAEKIEAPFHPIMVGSEEMVAVLSDAVYYSEGLAINNHLSAKFILNREIKKAGFKVALTGEGSDELFAGYIHLQHDFLPKISHAEMVLGVHTTNDTTLPLEDVQKQLGFVPTFIKAKAAIGYKINQLLTHTPCTPAEITRNLLINPDLSVQFSKAHPVNQATYLWIKYALTSYILRTLGDGCEMAHGIEGRVPFLDHHLFEFSKKIPLTMKIRENSDKFILRQTVQSYLTKELIQRKKQPFIAPPFSLLADNKGYEFLRDCIQSYSGLPFVNKAKLNQFIDAVPKSSKQEQIAAEPVLMLLLTASILGQRYRL